MSHMSCEESDMLLLRSLFQVQHRTVQILQGCWALVLEFAYQEPQQKLVSDCGRLVQESVLKLSRWLPGHGSGREAFDLAAESVRFHRLVYIFGVCVYVYIYIRIYKSATTAW